MNHILSHARRCVEDYDMIQAGDHIAVGVSGGKDSMVLLAALARLKEFYPKPFTVEAITLDLGIAGMDFSPVADWCAQRDIPYTVIPTEINHIIFNVRKEKNPCSMCAKMRRGALHGALQERGIKKIALGHHYDDAIETFYMCLFYEGRLSCFQCFIWSRSNAARSKSYISAAESISCWSSSITLSTSLFDFFEIFASLFSRFTRES